MRKLTINISWLDNYGASSEDVLGCVATGETLEDVKKNYIEALEFHLEDSEEKIIFKDCELSFKMDVHALLHYFEGTISRSTLARLTGINQRQLGHYAQGIRKPKKEQRAKIINSIHKLGEEFISVV